MPEKKFRVKPVAFKEVDRRSARQGSEIYSRVLSLYWCLAICIIALIKHNTNIVCITVLDEMFSYLTNIHILKNIYFLKAQA